MYKKPLAIIFSLSIDILSDTKPKQYKYHCCYKLILFDIIIKLWFFSDYFFMYHWRIIIRVRSYL